MYENFKKLHFRDCTFEWLHFDNWDTLLCNKARFTRDIVSLGGGSTSLAPLWLKVRDLSLNTCLSVMCSVM